MAPGLALASPRYKAEQTPVRAMPNPMSQPYKRILLKLSGEVLMGQQQFGIDPEFVAELAAEVKAAKESGLEICLVIGGGNIFRGMGGSQGNGPGPGRLYGHACHGDERAGHAECAGADRR